MGPEASKRHPIHGPAGDRMNLGGDTFAALLTLALVALAALALRV
jgi:hypothetical protein